MWKIIVENYRLIIATTAAILSLIALIFNFYGWKRLRKVSKTDDELIRENVEVKTKAEKALKLGSIFLSVPALISEAEEIFKSPKSGSLKLGYVLQQVQKRFKAEGIEAKSSDLLDYIESILATPEKKGENNVSKAHETSQR